MGASAPFWRFSAASYPDLQETEPVNALAGTRDRSVISEADVSGGVSISLSFQFDFSLQSIFFFVFVRCCIYC